MANIIMNKPWLILLDERMSSMKKKMSILMLTVVFIISCLSSAFASDNFGTPEKVIYSLIDSINNNSWDTYISLQVNSNKDTYRLFFNNDQNKKDNIGLLDVQQAKIEDIKLLPVNEMAKLAISNEYLNTYPEVTAYYVAIDFKVKEENKYFFNGTNFRIIFLAKENSEWKVLQESDAPIEILVSDGFGFNTESEKIAMNILNERYKGNIINKEGKLLSTNKNENVKANKDLINKINNKTNSIFSLPVVISASDTEEPSTIRVYRTATGTVSTPSFIPYVKDVLPNE